MKCDVIAEGVVAAVKEVGLQVPLVVRLEGTNVELGKEIIATSNLNVVSADDLDDAAQKIVTAVRGGANLFGGRSSLGQWGRAPARDSPMSAWLRSSPLFAASADRGC